jgi:hypothetical protein
VWVFVGDKHSEEEEEEKEEEEKEEEEPSGLAPLVDTRQE